MIDERLAALERALWQAPPHAVADAAMAAVTAAFEAQATELWLVDYQVAYLVPAGTGGEPLRIEQTLPGRAFASQQTVREPLTAVPGQAPDAATPVRLHLPLTVYGDRLGVLSVEFGQAPTPEQSEGLAGAAIVLARALAVADSRTDTYRRIRRRARLTLAAEIQWDLLPGRACVADEYSMAGQLEPAYAVWGDNFDWSAAPDHLTVTVTNGMGQGIEAALLTQLTISALRNARRAGADLIEQAMLANEAIYAQHRGDRHVGTLLLRFDLETGRVRAIDAGSPKVYRLRRGAVTPIELEPQLPLGMFNDSDYLEQDFELAPGDRMIIVSDGVHNFMTPTGEIYGTFILPHAFGQTRLQNPPEVVRTLMREVLNYNTDTGLADDAVIVCLDWTGRPLSPQTVQPRLPGGDNPESHP
ncbi:PP2C family protein-serine/threonine phosphatase [Spirillospora sp. NPDC049652]